jgi:RNA polymerase sigma-70 factor (sigma-E family)
LDFEDYVAARGEALLRLARVLTGDPFSAEDLAQATLADVLRRWEVVCRAGHPDAYVRRAMVNRYLSWRRRKAATEVPVPDLEVFAAASLADPVVGVAARDELRRVLDRLAPRARAILVLRYYADLDDAAIADSMGIRASSVRATVSRALAALRLDVTRGDREELR